MEKIYSDFNQYELGVDPLVYNLSDIEQAIDNILVTVPSERFFLPEFGCNIRSALFELATSSNTFAIHEMIRNAILRWEGSRLEIVDSQSYVRFVRDQNLLIIHFEFNIPALHIKNYTYARSILLERLR